MIGVVNQNNILSCYPESREKDRICVQECKIFYRPTPGLTFNLVIGQKYYLN